MIEPRTDDWALICPHCGCRHTDPWEYLDEDEHIDRECDECGATFEAWLSVRRLYHSKPKEAQS